MMRITLDGVELVTDEATRVRVGLDVARVTGLEEQGREVRFSVPAVPGNLAALGDVVQVRSAAKFNHEAHRVCIEAGGCVILEGNAFLLSVERAGDGAERLSLLVRETQPGWVREAAENMLAAAPVEFSCVISGQEIRDSWSGERAVRLLPVQRGAMVQNANGSVIPPARILTPEDYHPFIHVESLLRAIVEGAGYTLRSSFVETDFFRSLCISGRYPVQSTAAARSRMDFRAGCTANRTAAADRYGKVKADPLTSVSSLGNIVETADGNLVQGAFNTGGVFQMVGQRVAFVPPYQVQVGFEYYFHYSTPYRIASRSALDGFNSIVLGDNRSHTFTLANRFEDQREKVLPGLNYRFIVFNLTAGAYYQLQFKRMTSSGAVETSSAVFSTRTYSYTFPSGYPITDVRLLYKPTGSSVYIACPHDWALYEGWVTETGTTEVEVTLSSAPEQVTPASPKYFDSVAFEGAEQGWELTLFSDTHLRPLFSAAPTTGTSLRFADVAPAGVRQIELLEALGHMFDLRFVTDRLTRQVWIEPAAEFEAAGQVVDWTQKGELSRTVVVREPGEGMSRSSAFRYRDQDITARAWDEDNGEVLGQWIATLDSQLCSRSRTTSVNPLFNPCVSLRGEYTDAPAAWLMQAATEDGGLNFPLRIVRYAGMEALPAGQTWGWPAATGSYPLAGFFLPGHGLSLCFEDREGVEGLHRFLDGRFRALEAGRRITLPMRLSPADFEALTRFDGTGGNLKSMFLVEADREHIPCRLESVQGYDPSGEKACLCTFLTV